MLWLDNPPANSLSPQVIEAISGYAVAIDAPLYTHTTVTRVNATDDGYDVQTDQGTWSTASVSSALVRLS